MLGRKRATLSAPVMGGLWERAGVAPNLDLWWALWGRVECLGDRKRVLLTGNWNARAESDRREEQGANYSGLSKPAMQ